MLVEMLLKGGGAIVVADPCGHLCRQLRWPVASHPGSYVGVDLLVHLSGMPRQMVRAVARMLTRYAHEWPDRESVMEWPLAWAKESVEGSGHFLSLTARILGMRARIRRSESLQWYFCGDNGSSGWKMGYKASRCRGISSRYSPVTS